VIVVCSVSIGLVEKDKGTTLNETEIGVY